MPGLRLLLTGPPRESLRAQLIRRASLWATETDCRSSALWIAPSPLACDQIARALALEADPTPSSWPRVWCWDQVWSSIASAASSDALPPARLSPVGVRAVLGEAIQRARETDVLGPLVAAIDQPGLQRRLLSQFATWLRNERSVAGPPPGKSPAELAQWALFGHFCETLGDINACTPESWATWASHRLVDDPPPGWRNLDQTLLTLVEPVAPLQAVRRVIDFWNERAGAMIVSLPFDPEPALAEVYAAVEPTRRFFLDRGFVEQSPLASSSVTAIDGELFRSDAHSRPLLAGTGLQVLGGPKGEGQALLIARRVQTALAAGTSPDEILILVSREDEDVATVRSVLGSWSIPVAPGPTHRLATLPTVATLRLILQLSVNDYEVATLARLLRNGEIHWSRFDLDGSFRRFEVATTLCGTRVYRNQAKLRKALDRFIAETDSATLKQTNEAARHAVDLIAGWIDPLVRSRSWRIHADRLRELASKLGLDEAKLAPLWDALEDHAWVLDQVGAAIAALPIRWSDFVAQIERVIADAEPIPSPPSAEAGTVRVAVVGTVDAARASLVILANLAEKTWPTPDAVPLELTRTIPASGVEPMVATDPAPVDTDDPIAVDPAAEQQTNLAYAREMLRFTRAVAAADSAVTLTYPTTDTTGEGLLPAGFLDEVLRRLDPTTGVIERHDRFDPVLRGHEALAVASGDARVLAVAQACDGDPRALSRLATHPDHAGSLRGVADAFRVGHFRRERFDFNGYDGWLMDGDAVARVAESFGTEHTFSPSQLESYAFCPFQFFQRYVLGLKPADGPEELAEDYAGRGKDVHRVLEMVHQAVQPDDSTELASRLAIHIETQMRVELDRIDHDSPPGEADVAEVLREIDTRRTGKALERYLAQFQNYTAKGGAGAIPHQFEVLFGQPEKPNSLGHLTLGEGHQQIKLQGVIDRIDLVPVDGATRFRVIDYKTGSNPSPADVKSGLASQLPLYAMAVERLVLPSGEIAFLDAGYWSLPKDGYKGVKLDAWEDYRERMIAFVLAMVRELRRGVFPIASQESNCTQFCDFHKTCRVGEVRSARKAWNDRPTLEVLPS